MPGREYNDGLQQAIQAKEGVEIKQETVVLATSLSMLSSKQRTATKRCALFVVSATVNSVRFRAAASLSGAVDDPVAGPGPVIRKITCGSQLVSAS